MMIRHRVAAKKYIQNATHRVIIIVAVIIIINWSSLVLH